MTEAQTDSRLDAVESAVAEIERAFEDLSEIVRRQHGEIDTLKAEIKFLGRQILALTEGERE